MAKFNESEFSQWIQQHRVMEQLQDAIRCNTVNPPGNEWPLAEKIRHILDSHGIESDVLTYPHLPGRVNLIARLRGSEKGRTLIFSGHMDTVPIGENKWNVDPFSGEIKDGKLYGRGSSDMKGGLYALLYAMIKCKQDGIVTKGELIFVATFGEETGCEGAQIMVAERELPPFDAMIIAEPSDNQLFIAHKGVLWLKVEVTGKTAHSSMPKHGINAILALQKFMNKLKTLQLDSERHPLLSPATLTPTTINGGVKTNMVPDYGEMTIDLRLLPGQSSDLIYEDIVQIANEISNDGQGAKLKVAKLLDLPALTTDPRSDIVTAVQSVLQEGFHVKREGCGVNYFTDGSVFQKCGNGNIIVMGPGRPELAHQPDEHIEIAAFMQSIYIYHATAAHYLA